jgi:hypothetical protein
MPYYHVLFVREAVEILQNSDEGVFILQGVCALRQGGRAMEEWHALLEMGVEKNDIGTCNA